MRRLLIRSAIVLATTLAMLLPTPTAEAGNGYWSTSVCRPDTAVYDDWAHFTVYFSKSPYGVHQVWDHAHQIYWDYNGGGGARECGWLHIPIDNGGWYQNNLGEWLWIQKFLGSRSTPYGFGGMIRYNQNRNRWEVCEVYGNGAISCWLAPQ